MSYEKYYETDTIQLLTELLSIPAPSAREEMIAEKIRCEIAECGYESTTDHAGNVSVRLGPAGVDMPPVILASHMDEIAMTVTVVEPDGRLKVRNSGGLRPYKIGEGMVDLVGDNGIISGVLSFGSAHGNSSGHAWDDVCIFTGLKPDDLKKAGIRPGTSAVPSAQGRGPVVFGDPADPFVAAWTFDDRMGVVTLLRLLERIEREKIEIRRPLIISFTIHEEGGCHGAKVLARRECPEVFIAVDGCPVTPEAPLQLDGSPGIWSLDSHAHYDQKIVQSFCRIAESTGISLQAAVYNSASSDASRVYDVGAAPRVATIGHVRENSHGFEIARLSVFDNLLEILVQFLKEI